MKMTDFIITMILVGVVIVCIYAFAIDLNKEEHLNVEINTSYADTYNKVTELMNETNRTQTNVIDILSDKERGALMATWDAWQVTKEVIFGTAKVTGGTIVIATTLLGDFAQDLELPSIVYFALITIITVLVIGALIFLLIKRRW